VLPGMKAQGLESGRFRRGHVSGRAVYIGGSEDVRLWGISLNGSPAHRDAKAARLEQGEDLGATFRSLSDIETQSGRAVS
jgi:hypothetical protein